MHARKCSLFLKWINLQRKGGRERGRKGGRKEGDKIGNLTHVPSKKQNLRTEKLTFHKCLIYRKLIMLECSYKSGSWWRLPHINLWKCLLMVSRDMSKTRPRSRWSHKINWIKLYLYDWTGFVNLGNFQIWSPFVFLFSQTLTELSNLYIPYSHQTTPSMGLPVS